MFWLITKTVISAVLITAISEIGKRNSWLAAILASLPLSTLMAVTWLYTETKDPQKVAALATGIAWALVPSYIILLGLPLLLKAGVRFEWALPVSCLVMVIGYFGYMLALKKLGIEL